MGSFSTYLENAVLGHVTGRTTYTKPTNTYLALYLVAPTISGGGTEVSAGDYARQQITWGAPAGGTIANSADIRFPAGAGTASTSWGTIVAVGLHDTLADGNLLVLGNLSAVITVASGDAFKIVSGGLNLALS